MNICTYLSTCIHTCIGIVLRMYVCILMSILYALQYSPCRVLYSTHLHMLNTVVCLQCSWLWCQLVWSTAVVPPGSPHVTHSSCTCTEMVLTFHVYLLYMNVRMYITWNTECILQYMYVCMCVYVFVCVCMLYFIPANQYKMATVCY